MHNVSIFTQKREEVMGKPLVLVNESNEIIGYENEKIVHVQGLLHRAILIYLFNPEGKMLIQKRTKSKLHSIEKWDGSCSRHVRKGQTILQTAQEGLFAELGISAHLKPLCSVIYKVTINEAMVEYEYGTFFLGLCDNVRKLSPNSNEILATRWEDLESLSKKISKTPRDYALWFHLSLLKFIEYLNNNLRNEHDSLIPNIFNKQIHYKNIIELFNGLNETPLFHVNLTKFKNKRKTTSRGKQCQL